MQWLNTDTGVRLPGLVPTLLAVRPQASYSPSLTFYLGEVGMIIIVSNPQACCGD